MPRLSEFYGIVIRINGSDHQPPHLHARYGGCQAEIDLRTMTVLQGNLSSRALALVIEWALQHAAELDARWERARHQLSLEPIEPLR